MTVLVSRNQQSYAPQTADVPFAVDPNATRVQVTLTHPNTLAAWPAGPLYQFDWDFGSGSTGKNSGNGGIRNDRTGTPIVGDVAVTFNAPKPAGAASGICHITVLQPLTSAILVESF